MGLHRRLDPVQVTQMAKYLETVYVSGWQSSSTASSTHEPGPDLAGKVCIYCLSRTLDKSAFFKITPMTPYRIRLNTFSLLSSSTTASSAKNAPV